jgi:putative endopeptidase
MSDIDFLIHQPAPALRSIRDTVVRPNRRSRLSRLFEHWLSFGLGTRGLARAYLGSIVASALVTGCSNDPAESVPVRISTTVETSDARQDAGKPAIGRWGVDVENFSKTVSPGDDFFTYVNERWLETATRPSGYSRFMEMNAMHLRTEARIKEIIEQPDEAAGSAGRQKIEDLYRSYMDLDGIERRGIGSIRADLDRILALRDHEGIARWMAHPSSYSIVTAYVFADAGNPERTILHLDQQQLFGRYVDLPDSANHHAAYRDYVAATLSRAGIDRADKRANALVALEKRLALVQWDRVKLADRLANYHPLRRAELERYAPGFPWSAFLDAKGVPPIEELVLNTDTAIQASARLFAETPVDVWKSYLLFHWIQKHAEFLPAAYRDASFAFYGKLLGGRDSERSRESRGVQFVNSNLPELIGRIYVSRYFPESDRVRMRELVSYLVRAWRERIESADWLDEPTRRAALAKIDTMAVEVGFPDHLREYAEVRISADDPIGNLHRLQEAHWITRLAYLNRPSKAWDWYQPPQTVDASYSPQLNRITFPAGILQPPAFDAHADPAVNFGSIGAVIGHEMGHGFDDQGSRFDPSGRLHNWWTPAARSSFERGTRALIEQYSAFQPLPGLHLKGQQLLNENIADLSGVEIAHAAYEMYLRDKYGGVAPVLDGFTGDQRFFLGWGQYWRALETESGLRQAVENEYHSPPRYRVNGVLRNIDAWYTAFNIKPSDELYLAPEERVRLW